MEIDFTGIDHALEQIQMSHSVDFKMLMQTIIAGKQTVNIDLIFQEVLKILTSEIVANRFTITSIILLSVLAAVMKNVSSAFKSKQIAHIGFYIMTLMMSILLLQTMKTTMEMASESVSHLITFMQALLPAYFMGVAFISGAASATTFYGTALIAIFLVETVIAAVILPMIQIYIVLVIVNQIAGEDMLEHLLRLLKSIITYMLKTAVALVIGINTIQSMFVPVFHSVKTGLLTSAVSILPGMSGVTETTWNTVVGSMVITKNAIGVTAVCVMLMIVMLPVVKLTVIMFMYRLGAAFAGSFTSDGTAECISGIGDATEMLLKTVVTSIILFMLTIAIVSVTTNGGF